MLKQRSVVSILACGLFLVAVSCSAQEVVHAVSGTVKYVNNKQETLTVAVEPDSDMQFKIQQGQPPALDFDQALRSDTVQAQKFDGSGDFAVVYFYGFDDGRTAVAVKDFGKVPLEKIVGTVKSYNKRTHEMTVHTEDGKEKTFHIDDKAVVDTGEGLESGREYRPDKGADVRVTANVANGNEVVVFVRSRSE